MSDQLLSYNGHRSYCVTVSNEFYEVCGSATVLIDMSARGMQVKVTPAA